MVYPVSDHSIDKASIHSLLVSYALSIQPYKSLDAEALEKRCHDCRTLTSAEAILQACATEDDMQVTIENRSLAEVSEKHCPLLVQDHRGHWYLLFKKAGDQYLIQSHEYKHPEQLDEAAMLLRWGGRVARITPIKKSMQFFSYFDVRWFIPEIVRFKGFILELVASACCIQIIALMIPLIFQVVMDKVIVNQARDTLTILVVVLVVMALTECLLQCARQYVSTHTANRIDARLGKKLYTHLTRLPLPYFQSRSIGVTVMRVTQLNRIREFITGAASTLVLDVFFLIIFLGVMCLYSPALTLIILCAIPACLAVAFIITPRLQQHLFTLYHHSAINSAFLTETLNGVETVKSQAVEPQMVQKFEAQTRDMVLANFRVSRLIQQQDMWVQLIQKVALALVIWFGARKVVQFELSIGQLIAFNMMAQHALQPITKLTQLWRDFIQTKVSLLQIGDILNTHTERQSSHANHNFKNGDIVFDNVHFRYDSQSSPVLAGLHVTIKQGQTVAIIGSSGSGKSTLIKLLQRLYIPEAGHIRIGGHDLSSLSVDELRQHIGVVSQDNFLFNRTVRDNIALSDPSVPLSSIIAVAKEAGAHDFIVGLDDGYDTIVDEGGHSLSGGQRQRIAIARALLGDPAILIFDEATSALDEIAQKQVQANLLRLSRNRTVIMIAHRLSTVRHCDQIHVIKDKSIYESGTHGALMANPRSEYATLWRLQKEAKGSC